MNELTPRGYEVLFHCPKCGAPISHRDNYIGANYASTVRYYHCTGCGSIIRRPIK